MKTTMPKISLAFVALIAILALTCKDKKDDTNTNLLALYLLQGDRTDTTNINTPLGRASATANVVSSIGTSVTTPSNSSNFAFNTKVKKSIDQQLMAIISEIYLNGKDPILAKELIGNFIQQNLVPTQGRNEKVFTGWTGPTSSGGRNNYTYSGTVKGRDFVKKPITLTISGQPCTIETYQFATTSPTQFAERGTATFSNGQYSVSASNSNDITNRANIQFNGFGSIYTDAFAYYKDINRNGIGTPSATCEGFKTAYSRFDRFTKPVTMNGPLSFESTYLASGTLSGSFSLKSKSTSNSTGLVITQDNTTTPSLTIESLVYDSNFALSFAGSSYTGTVTITITGKINGDTLTETLTLNF